MSYHVHMSNPAALLRDSRRRTGLTQRQLALRLGVSQAAIAKLERPGANPTFETLAGALWATGHRLELEAPARRGGVDESLVRRQLELTPSERLHGLEAMYAQARALALAGARSRGEHT
jgi:transcriptional regulator with XRE-family HTH domain